MRTARTLAALLLLAAATGCGGGAGSTTGSTGGSPPPGGASATSGPAAAAEPSSPATSGSTARSSSGSATPTASGSATTGGATVTARSFEFEMPRSVKPGATVRITNRDPELHTFVSRSAGLDVKAPPGKTVEFRAPAKPGTYRVVCTLHADMDTDLVVK